MPVSYLRRATAPSQLKVTIGDREINQPMRGADCPFPSDAVHTTRRSFSVDERSIPYRSSGRSLTSPRRVESPALAYHWSPVRSSRTNSTLQHPSLMVPACRSQTQRPSDLITAMRPTVATSKVPSLKTAALACRSFVSVGDGYVGQPVRRNAGHLWSHLVGHHVFGPA